MLIDFQSKFNHFNYLLFSDQVSIRCDFEFSSVLRGGGGWVVEGLGKWRRHGWGVVRSTNHPLLNFYNFCKYISSCVFFSSPFLTFWSSQLDFLQIADKFWIGQFQSSSSLFFSFTICHLWFFGWQKTLLLRRSDVRGSFFKRGWILL